MCARSFSKFKTAHMSREIFERCRQFFPFVQEVALFGWGEPTVHPDFGRMLEAVWGAGKETYFSTNGLCIDRFAEQIVRGNQPYLNIGVDAVDPQLYGRIRRGSDFYKVIENVKLIVRHKKKYDSLTPRLRFSFVAMKDNIHQLPDMADFAHELGVEAIKVLYLSAYSPRLAKQVMWHYPHLVEKYFGLLKKKAKKFGLKLYLPPLIQPGKDAEISHHRSCDVPWKEMLVDSRGKVRPCIPSTEVMGDVLIDDLTTIWGNKAFERLRKTVNSAKPLGECARCHQSGRFNVNAREAHLVYEADIVKNAGAAQE